MEVLEHLRGKFHRQRNLRSRSGTEGALQFASHKVATRCSLGREPKDQIVYDILLFFPAFIAATGGDKGWEKQNLKGPNSQPWACAQGYSMSLLRSWLSLCSIQSIKQISIHFLKKAQAMGLEFNQA